MADNKYELGKAYVQVVPSTEGISGKLSSAFSSEGSVAGDVFGATFGANMLSGVVAKAASAAMQVGQTLVNTVKEAVNNYGDYEQLTGGVEKLFGNSADTVIRYAEDAYKTAGISANRYMEQITSFAASLTSSLGGDTKAAAEMGNQAVIDMADNANTFGTSIESIQNAYQGFSKQNYTMLDNLKLGYGGTKTEMERLLTDAEKLSSTFKAQRDSNGNLTLSFSDIVEAIHLVQTEMNVTGTTAKEAASTLQGSAGTAKAAWENVLTTLGDGNGDVRDAVEDWTDAVKVQLENTGKTVVNVFKNIPDLVAGVCSAAYDAITDHYIQLGDTIVGTGELLKANEDYFQNQIDFMNDSLIPLEENQSMLNQLKDLVNENGVVAEENLPRAKYLVDELNDAYGTTLELQGDRLIGYDTELAKIQELIDNEKTRLLTEQVQSNTETAMDNLTTNYQAYQEVLDDLTEAETRYQQAVNIGDTIEAPRQNYIIKERKKAIEEAQQAYDTALIIAENAQENELALQQGYLDRIVLLDEEQIAEIGSTQEAIAAIYDRQIADKQMEIEVLKQIRTEGNKEIIDAEIATAEEVIAEAQRQKDAKIQAAQEARDVVSTTYDGILEEELSTENERTQLHGLSNKTIHADTTDTYSKIYEAAQQNKKQTMQLAKETAAGSVKEFENKEASYATSGYNSMAGFEAGVKARLPISVGVMASAATAMHNALKSYNGESSPAKLYKRSGKFALEGYAMGIEENAKLAESAMEEMAEGVAGKTGLLSDIPLSLDTDGLNGVSVLDSFVPEAAADNKTEAAAGQTADSFEKLAEVFDEIKDTLSGIKAYLPILKEAAGKEIVLDSGELVGSITPKINDKMGEMRVAGNRGITCMA